MNAPKSMAETRRLAAFASEEANATIKALRAENLALKGDLKRLREILDKSAQLRPVLIKQLGYVPEPVLWFCNEARAALGKE